MPYKDPEKRRAYEERRRNASPEVKEERTRKQREYQLKNKERLKQYLSEYYKNNRDTFLERQRQKRAKQTEEEREAERLRLVEYYQRNRKELIAKQKRYYEENKEAQRAYHREHARQRYQENKQSEKTRFAAWKKANPGSLRRQDAIRRARKRNLPNNWTDKEQAFMHTYWKHACAICGNPKGLLWTLANDHWIPLASPDCPGTTALNIVPLCHGEGGCHNSKYKTDPHAWLLRRYGPKKAAKIEKAIATYFAAVALAFPEAKAS